MLSINLLEKCSRKTWTVEVVGIKVTSRSSVKHLFGIIANLVKVKMMLHSTICISFFVLLNLESLKIRKF